MPKPVVARRQRPGRRASAARWRCAPTSSSPRESRLLPARLREHRPGARRRLVALRARRASASRARPRWRCSASACRRAQALEWGLINRRLRRRRASRPRSTRCVERLAAGPTRSYAGTKRQLNAWLYARHGASSSSSRPRSSRRWRRPATSSRASTAFVAEAHRRASAAAEQRHLGRSPGQDDPAALRARRPSSARRAARAGALVAAGPGVRAAAGEPAYADLLAPESGGSPNADDIRHALLVHLGHRARRLRRASRARCSTRCSSFRARKGAVAAQIRGNTRLEIGWTVGAAVILVVARGRHVRQARRASATRRTPAPSGLSRPTAAARRRRRRAAPAARTASR